jgi:predicted MFS family arabinose efflux permease
LPHNGRLTQMSRIEHITILVLALVGVAVEVLTLLEAQEWTKFAVMVVTFAVILAGTYWFVLTQGDRGDGQGVRTGAKLRPRPGRVGTV